MTQLTQLTEIMTTTPEEDKQILNEVIEEVKVQKRPRGRPRIYKDYEERLACQRQRYHDDPTEKLKYVAQYYKDNKERLAIKRHERYLRDKEKARLLQA